MVEFHLMIRHGDLADNGVAVEEDLLEVDLPRLLALIPVMVQVPVSVLSAFYSCFLYCARVESDYNWSVSAAGVEYADLPSQSHYAATAAMHTGNFSQLALPGLLDCDYTRHTAKYRYL